MNRFLLSFRKSYLYPLLIFFFVTNVILSIFFAIGLFGNIYIFTNVSKSMHPTIELGDLTMVKRQSIYSYKKNDIITFYAKNGDKVDIITHRIERLGGNVYITKGDSNTISDKNPVTPRQIIGKVIAIIPYIGYLVIALNSIAGKIFFIILPMIVIISIEVLYIQKTPSSCKTGSL